jgi:hypothetical protein
VNLATRRRCPTSNPLLLNPRAATQARADGLERNGERRPHQQLNVKKIRADMERPPKRKIIVMKQQRLERQIETAKNDHQQLT